MHISREPEKDPYNYREAVRALLHVSSVTLKWVGGALVAISAPIATLAAVSDEAKTLMETEINSFIHTYQRVNKAYHAEDNPADAPKVPSKETTPPVAAISSFKPSTASSNTRSYKLRTAAKKQRPAALQPVVTIVEQPVLTYTEQRRLLGQHEGQNWRMFIDPSSIHDRRNMVNRMVVEGIIKSSASAATYKNVTLRIRVTSSIAGVTEENKVIEGPLYPGGSVPVKFKIKAPARNTAVSYEVIGTDYYISN